MADCPDCAMLQARLDETEAERDRLKQTIRDLRAVLLGMKRKIEELIGGTNDENK